MDQIKSCEHVLTPEEAGVILQLKLPWRYQHSRSSSAPIRDLDDEAKQAKSPEELIRPH